MNNLAKQAIDAHGGLERWNRFTTLSAHLIQKGALCAAKGKAGVLVDPTVTVDFFATRRLRTGHLVPQIEGLASNRNRGLRSKDTLPSGAICSSPTSPDTRCGPI